jgi:hypothetical protein
MKPGYQGFPGAVQQVNNSRWSKKMFANQAKLLVFCALVVVGAYLLHTVLEDDQLSKKVSFNNVLSNKDNTMDRNDIVPDKWEDWHSFTVLGQVTKDTFESSAKAAGWIFKGWQEISNYSILIGNRTCLTAKIRPDGTLDAWSEKAYAYKERMRPLATLKDPAHEDRALTLAWSAEHQEFAITHVNPNNIPQWGLETAPNPAGMPPYSYSPVSASRATPKLTRIHVP